MTNPQPLPALAPDETLAGETAVERTERRLRTLRRIIERGADLAEALAIRGQETRDIDEMREATLGYDRVTRSVRRSVAMEMRVEDRHDARAAARRDEVAAEAAAELGRRIATRKRQVIEVITDAVERADDEGELGEACSNDLLRDLHERLDDVDDTDEVFADRPLDEAIARLCRYIGVTPDGRATAHTKDTAVYERLLQAARTGAPDALEALRAFTPTAQPRAKQTAPPDA